MKKNDTQFSSTALKKIKRMSKNELINAVINMHNYAEQQKTASIILMKSMEELKLKLAEQKKEEAAPQEENK